MKKQPLVKPPDSDEEARKAREREYGREYRAKNREKILQKQRKWRAKNPEYSREYYTKQRAIVLAVKELGLLEGMPT